MSTFAPTHYGVVLIKQPGPNRPPLQMRCPLRATARFYVTRHGTKYRKQDGTPVTPHALQRHYLDTLDVSTVEAIPNE